MYVLFSQVFVILKVTLNLDRLKKHAHFTSEKFVKVIQQIKSLPTYVGRWDSKNISSLNGCVYPDTKVTFCFCKLVSNSKNHFGIYKSIFKSRSFGHEPKTASNQEKSASAAKIKNREKNEILKSKTEDTFIL